MGAKNTPTLHVEPAIIVVPQLVELLSMLKCVSEIERGEVKLKIVGSEVTETLQGDGRALTDHDGPEVDRGRWIGDFS